MHSEGKKRHGKFRRGLHKVHKRVRDAKGKGREVVSLLGEEAALPRKLSSVDDES